MLLELPDGLQQDELLYSAIARGARPIRPRDARDVLGTVFGATTIVAPIDLPSRLDAAGTRLLCLRDEADAGAVLLHRHTLYPFYAAVAAPTVAERAATLMLGAGGSRVHGLLGVRASAISAPARLRWCPDCLVADRERAGHGWWRRRHQLAGVPVCPMHGRPLLESSLLTSSARQRLAFQELESTITAADPPAIDMADGRRAATLLLVARAAAALLDRPPSSPCGPEGLWFDRLSALRDAGLVRGERQVDALALRRALDARFGAELLEALGCRMGEAGSDDWVARMSRKPRGAMHPLYHALFAVLLDRPIPDQVSESRPAEADAGAASSVGAPSSRPDRARTMDGDARLVALVGRPDMSLRRIADELAMDPMTVKRRAHLLGVWRDGWKLDARVPPATRATRNADIRLDDARRRWRAAALACAALTRNAIRAAEPAAFALLYRRDRQWLEANSPPVMPRRGGAVRVDWAGRDADVATRIAAAAAEMTANEGATRSRAISPATLARAADVLALVQRRGGRMPRTVAALARHSEDGLALARGRLGTTAARLAAEGSPGAARTVLARAAGLGPGRLRQIGREVDEAVGRIAAGEG